MAQPTLGLFPISYTVTTGLDGAPTLHLNLLVNTPAHKVTGTANITNGSIHPPLKLHADAWGEFTYLALMPPSQTHILIVGQGNHGGPTANSIVFVKFRLVVEKDWSSGKGSFSYFYNNEWHEIENATVSLNPVFIPPFEPGPVIPSNGVARGLPINALYAAPIHQAIASNSPLSELKALAQQAQQQLDNLPNLKDALDSLKAEIKKLGE